MRQTHRTLVRSSNWTSAPMSLRERLRSGEGEGKEESAMVGVHPNVVARAAEVKDRRPFSFRRYGGEGQGGKAREVKELVQEFALDGGRTVILVAGRGDGIISRSSGVIRYQKVRGGVGIY